MLPLPFGVLGSAFKQPAAPAGRVTAAATFTLNTSTGLQELTIPGLGWTPKGALAILTRAVALGSDAPDQAICIGLLGGDGAGGLEESCFHTFQKDNVATTAANFGRHMDAFLADKDEASVIGLATAAGDGAAGNPGFIAGGVRINITEAFDGACKVGVVFFKDATHCKVYEAATVDGDSIEITDVPFPCAGKLVIGATATRDFTTGTYRSTIACGFATGSTGAATQSCAAIYGSDNVATTDEDTRASDDAVCKAVYGANNLAAQYEVRDLDAQGCTLKSVKAVSHNDIGLLFVDVSTAVWVGGVDSPTSAGSDWIQDGPGWQPELWAMIPTNADDWTNSEPGSVIGLAASDGDREFCASVRGRHNVSTSQSKSRHHTRILDLKDHDGTTLHDAANLQFTAAGVKIAAVDISVANGTARKWPAFAIKA